MKNIIVVSAIFIILSYCAVFAVPGLTSYQGRLTDAAGKPLSTPVEVIFGFYDSETTGVLLGGFKDMDLITPNSEGVFSTFIGDAPDNLIPETIFSADSVWLDITVGAEKLTPRIKIVSVAYAMRSSVSDKANDADKIDGIDSGQILRNDQDGSISGSLAVSGNIGVKTINPSQALDVIGSIKASSSLIAPVIKASADNSVYTLDIDVPPNASQYTGLTIGKARAAAGQNNGQPYVWIRGNGAHSWILDYTPNTSFWAQSMGAYYKDVKQGNIGLVGTGHTVDYISMGFGGAYWWNSNSKLIIWKTGRIQFMPPVSGDGTGSLIEPTAWLVLSPGTSDVSGAPIKFRAGQNLTIPESGAMEWDGNNLYITNDSLVRKTIAYTDSDISFLSIKNGSLTKGRITFAQSEGLLSDDAKLVWDNTNKRLGVGVAPASTLHISGNDLNFVDRYTETQGFGAGLALRRARGSAAAPESVRKDDLLGSINYRGHNGAEFSQTAAAVFGYASEDWSSSAQGSYITANTTSEGGLNLLERMRIEADGDIGIGSSSPSAKLHVAGQSDKVQTKIQAHSTQTNDLTQWLSSGGAVVANISGGGIIKASGYQSSDGSAGITGTQSIVTSVTQDPVTKNITVTTKTLTFKNGLITGIE